ncbi:MAG: TonB-dependent receptor, partial [Haliea sp.]
MQDNAKNFHSGTRLCTRYSLRRASVAILLVVVTVTRSVAAGNIENEAPEVYTSDGGARLVYTRSYFSDANVLTGEDLLKYLPGGPSILREFEESASSEQRGFGTNGPQILVDGTRITAKSGGVTAVLQRIQAIQVKQVEVIRGSVAGLAVRSDGTNVNFVLNEDARPGAGLWELTALHLAGSDDTEYGGQMSYALSNGSTEYLVAASHVPEHEFRSDRFLLSSATRPFEIQEGQDVEVNTKTTATASINYTFKSGGIIGITGSLIDSRIDEHVLSDRYVIDAGADRNFDHSRLKDRALDSTTWEVSGSAGFLLGSSSAVDILYLSRSRAEEDRDQYFRTDAFQEMEHTRQQTVRVDYSENILRSIFRWQLSAGRTIELGGEYANNALNQQSWKRENHDGTFVDVDLRNADSSVTERRFEATSALKWQIRPDTHAEVGLDAEYSQLDQQGTDVELKRTFLFWKPRANVRYNWSEYTQLRASVHRSVSQLDFGNFVTGFSGDSQQSDALLAGNPELVPSKTWRYELALEMRSAGGLGTVSFAAFHEAIDDHIDQAEVFPGVSGTGNIGPARVLGVEAKADLRLDGLGISGGLLDGRYLHRDSSVKDPFTGEQRGIARMNRDIWNINFRQDLSWHNLAYGLSVRDQSATFVSEIDYFHNVLRQPVFDAFVELKSPGNLTFRLEGSDLLRSQSDRDRYVFDGN